MLFCGELLTRTNLRLNILLSTLTSVASNFLKYSLRLDNWMSARPPRSVNGAEITTRLLTNHLMELVVLTIGNFRFSATDH